MADSHAPCQQRQSGAQAGQEGGESRGGGDWRQNELEDVLLELWRGGWSSFSSKPSSKAAAAEETEEAAGALTEEVEEESEVFRLESSG